MLAPLAGFWQIGGQWVGGSDLTIADVEAWFLKFQSVHYLLGVVRHVFDLVMDGAGGLIG